jgi:hypothetical protein
MPPGAAAALLPFAGLAANVVVQTLVLRASGGTRFRGSLLAGFAAGLAVMAALLALPAVAGGGAGPGVWGTALLAGGAYAGFGFGYFSFLNLNQASLRVRIMKELLAEGGSLALADLLERYNAGQILEARLARLVEGGQLEARPGCYASGTRGDFLRLARLLDALKLLVTGRRTGG